MLEFFPCCNSFVSCEICHSILGPVLLFSVSRLSSFSKLNQTLLYGNGLRLMLRK
jgi:hypothetical protein